PISLHHWVDGRKPLHLAAHRALRSGAIDGRPRLLAPPTSNHPRARARLNLEESDWARLEGQAIADAVHHSDPCDVAIIVDRSGLFCNRCADLAGSRPAHRKTPCHVTTSSTNDKGSHKTDLENALKVARLFEIGGRHSWHL